MDIRIKLCIRPYDRLGKPLQAVALGVHAPHAHCETHLRHTTHMSHLPWGLIVEEQCLEHGARSLLLQRVVRAGAAVDALTRSGRATALHRAAHMGHLEVVNLL